MSQGFLLCRKSYTADTDGPQKLVPDENMTSLIKMT